ncbi:hypothetical protein Rsub_00826 [Raphidocelis subcapitata]|uniref:Uncharacterized protein n=1 Tax=Raphidocelis subcapitata TaxID=307507 RepID=A0A2V0NL49_9CHLO|nr:hypothetical protein Rsub_00826 [Raphidocelis subcapitata]|eukprot:GBF88114.1 hypothetical protein Rsub_00826 [Raphidocelis subcapitata]
MAAAATVSRRKVAGVVAGGGLAVYGAYWASQAGVVTALERQREDLETKVFVSQSKARRAESDALETEALIGALRQQSDLDSAVASEIAAQLEAARAEVSRLEAAQQQRRDSAARAKREAAEAAARLEQLRLDAVQFKADASKADAALGIAAAEVAAARQRMSNPLKHPLVAQWRGGGKT